MLRQRIAHTQTVTASPSEVMPECGDAAADSARRSGRPDEPCLEILQASSSSGRPKRTSSAAAAKFIAVGAHAYVAAIVRSGRSRLGTPRSTSQGRVARLAREIQYCHGPQRISRQLGMPAIEAHYARENIFSGILARPCLASKIPPIRGSRASSVLVTCTSRSRRPTDELLLARRRRKVRWRNSGSWCS